MPGGKVSADRSKFPRNKRNITSRRNRTMRNLILRACARVQLHQNREEGQTVIEYALVVALVSIVLAVTLVGFGNNVIGFAEDAVDAVV